MEAGLLWSGVRLHPHACVYKYCCGKAGSSQPCELLHHRLSVQSSFNSRSDFVVSDDLMTLNNKQVSRVVYLLLSPGKWFSIHEFMICQYKLRRGTRGGGGWGAPHWKKKGDTDSILLWCVSVGE